MNFLVLTTARRAPQDLNFDGLACSRLTRVNR